MDLFSPITQTHLQYTNLSDTDEPAPFTYEDTSSPVNTRTTTCSDVAFTCEDESSQVNIQTPTRVPRFGVCAFRGSCAEPEPLEVVSDIVSDPGEDDVIYLKHFSPPSWSEIALELLLMYSQFTIWISSGWKTLAGAYPFFRALQDWSQQLSMSISIIYGEVLPDTRSKEPSTNWVNTIYLRKDGETAEDATYNIEEQYTLPDSDKTYSDENGRIYDNYTQYDFVSAYRQAENSQFNDDRKSVVDSVIWSHDTARDEQIVRICYPRSGDSESDAESTGGRGGSAIAALENSFSENIEYSKVEFLCIEFHDPALHGGNIEIRLPKSLMLVNNELFSPAFVFRWMKYYHGRNFPFSKESTIHLMDDNVNQYVLWFGDYVVLGKTGITIVRARQNEMDPTSTLEECQHAQFATNSLWKTTDDPSDIPTEQEDDCFVEIQKSDTLTM